MKTTPSLAVPWYFPCGATFLFVAAANPRRLLDGLMIGKFPPPKMSLDGDDLLDDLLAWSDPGRTDLDRVGDAVAVGIEAQDGDLAVRPLLVRRGEYRL